MTHLVPLAHVGTSHPADQHRTVPNATVTVVVLRSDGVRGTGPRPCTTAPDQLELS
ncbi:hypothetical protein [Streptomyces sp. NPDC002851]